MRLLIQHRSKYLYPSPAALGPHVIRLRPANHTKAIIETYRLQVEPSDAVELRWQQDPYGNHVARLTFRAGKRISALEVVVELAADVRPVNPFDFFVDDRCKKAPFVYPEELRQDLLPFLQQPGETHGPLLTKFIADLPAGGKTVDFIVALNLAVGARTRYVIREEAGIWTPEETLRAGRGSCRDSAVLLMAALRARGFAARFVSGYLVQLTDEGMIPDAPRGVGRDVVDLHAWAEVYLPGAGWIGLDATSGLLCGEGHIPLACTASSPLAAPIDGTSDVAATDVSFQLTVGRLGHEPRPTAPFTDEVFEQLLAAGDLADARLRELGVTLTVGGEPTFNSREHTEAPEWNGEALGATKWTQGLRLAAELRRRLAPGATTMQRMGKHYPGESLPRWALDIIGRKDGAALWTDVVARDHYGPEHSKKFAEALSRRLGATAGLQAAYEDPWRHLQDEASLPVDVDPLHANLDDGEERRRLARVLDRGLGNPAGWVLPLRREPNAGAWTTEAWTFRRGHLFLIQGDSPIGLRLPLKSLAAAPPPVQPAEEPVSPPDPRRAEAEEAAHQQRLALRDAAWAARVRTALSVEEREGRVFVFLPPVESVTDWLTLVGELDAVRQELAIDVTLEGYPPPSGQGQTLYKITVTPDPGVLEVNIPPTTSAREHAALLETVFDAALHAGLHAEKYMLDGRQAGSGGGNHITMGGPTPQQSPFLQRPDLLASLITFVQHHPSLSYMFTGLFVGPTSQAPRVDEARHDALYELEIALRRAFAARHDNLLPPPWLSDMLFRHLLVDVAGNTHRTELCIDKLFDPYTPHGRQGLVELRAFEMPPHHRMATAQALLVRALMAALAAEPYDAPLVRWGQTLHDRFLLPYFLWRDFADVLDFLASRGIPLPADAYRPFLELRCPVAGTMAAGDTTLEVRNALEPWHVLGEEMTAGGTSRYVDSSMERIEVRVTGLVPERHVVLVNGYVLPLAPTSLAGVSVAGVRFRAWAPPHSLQAHLGVHHPIRLDIVDSWARRSLGGCAYHVQHPEGRGYGFPPLTRFDASARRAQRFTIEGPLPSPITPLPTTPAPDAPYTLDLRRLPIDHPEPPPEPPEVE